MHTISSYRGNRPTNSHPHTHKQTGPITIHCAAASAQCNNTDIYKVQFVNMKWSEAKVTLLESEFLPLSIPYLQFIDTR